MDMQPIADAKQQLPGKKASSSKPVNTGSWSPAEDSRLRDAVAQYGTRWAVVAAEVATRNGDQCAKRWNENLNPDLDHGPWSSREDKLLMNLVKSFGNNWKFIASSFLEARAPLSLKNRHSLLMRRLKRQQGGVKQPSSSSGSASTTVPLSPGSLRGSLDITTTLAGRIATPTFPTKNGNSGAASPFGHSPNGTGGDRTRPTSTVDSAADLTNLFTMDSKTTGNSNTAGTTTASATGYLEVENHYLSPTEFSSLIPSDASNSNSPFDGAELQWEDQDTWQPLLTSVDTVLSGHATRARNSSGMMMDSAVHSKSSATSVHQPLNESRSDQTQGMYSESSVDRNAVEYSVTCRREKLKTVVQHLVNAAMTETAGPSAEEEQVTLTLRLKSR